MHEPHVMFLVENYQPPRDLEKKLHMTAGVTRKQKLVEISTGAQCG